jgi:hypothetical protein
VQALQERVKTSNSELLQGKVLRIKGGAILVSVYDVV